jgi:hypothetical protein
VVRRLTSTEVNAYFELYRLMEGGGEGGLAAPVNEFVRGWCKEVGEALSEAGCRPIVVVRREF